MATLVRAKSDSFSPTQDDFLDSRIPEPFPNLTRLQPGKPQDELLEQLAQEEVNLDDELMANQSRVLDNVMDEREEMESKEVMPSIASVQQSCIMTLNNLLSSSSLIWQPIVPNRRHSMPSRPQASSAESSSALHTLLLNLRTLDTADEMIETTSSDESQMIRELERRVHRLTSTFNESDAQLAHALVTLLSHIHRLSIINPTAMQNRRSRASATPTWGPIDPFVSSDPIDTLTRKVSDLQFERLDVSEDRTDNITTPVLKVETALLWNRIDEELEIVLSLCRARTEASLPPKHQLPDHLPPEYEYDTETYDELSHPPEYDPATRPSFDSIGTKSGTGEHPTASTSTSQAGGLSEKMRLDLDAITMAIDRLYMVAPQLHNQRVELKRPKIEQMERARLAKTEPAAPPRIERAQTAREASERDVKELDQIIDLLAKSSERKLVDQAVVVEGGMKARLEKAKQRDLEKREAFVEQLMQHSAAGRLHSQDAVLQPTKTYDPEALLTLPEFIRERIPQGVNTQDPEALLSLPEFVNEPIPQRPAAPPIGRFSKMSKRSRSLSAPPLAWLMPSSSRPSTPPEGKDSKTRRLSRPTSSGGKKNTHSRAGLDVRYVAEHHENLQHVLVFMSVHGSQPGLDLSAEVYPPTGATEPDVPGPGDRLMLKCGSRTSQPLALPVRVVPGKKDVKVQSGHFEVKLATLASVSSSTTPNVHTSDSPALLDATQLSAQSPTSFICASCSLPLVQSSRIVKYADLPSEYWAELLDAWMCHDNQKLHEQVAKHGQGFWPEAGQALVGGSYILFEHSAVVDSNLKVVDSEKRDEDWHPVRCICGSVVGRCQEHTMDGQAKMVYRLAKYAIRPVSLTIEPIRVPLSAFIVEDMMEHVQAHATYRFIILDEEEERPRILMWLFKPSIRIAYTTPAQYALPKSGSIHAAKVLFKLLGPSTMPLSLSSILDKYPGFPQAERLLYPIDICRRLAALLKESNTSYPESMRMMTGLDVGWLTRG